MISIIANIKQGLEPTTGLEQTTKLNVQKVDIGR